ncbi:NAD-dependent deacylase [Alkalicaulis satelles]|uniref:NAD-dependent protein deacylase n=1 Tax=Alkalicaulis satelles TaxID=2609175 RepID=A0A5M6ZCJ2_9PROT|nr:NAD-dependent deacylase [Alkalicaulis satelles]KAA5802399.1 NAD-dependent deacylase [Alkalicaulis satelles]
MNDQASNIVILTGAGVSAESGLGTFRDVGGIWAKFDPMKLATPEGYAEDPDGVLEFYSARRENLIGARPNGAHLALAGLEQAWMMAGRGDFLLVTQNIDDLHEQAGSAGLIHMHGELLKTRCTACGHVFADREALALTRICPSCGHAGGLRPHVVWFGEMPLGLDPIYEALARADLFVAIGTSCTVWPAAGFVQEARAAGAWTVELSLEPGEVSALFDERHYGPATQIVPDWVRRLAGSD